ncbi:HK97-gp10 family putative phage morphogenesis protein [Rhizobium leucaenae]|jgi:HK97 gp10 family phage protein|uniref:HK97-gp10 family putative phage morphogenesis protein n=1 Tax=Rhizobium leucaenae TaxID=29450 RepID=UPI0007EE410E|nr:HK97-gp10 family putative phage morphogenesis protein [Rhizobium leucaenae]
MALKAKILGREALTAKLDQLAPAATKYAAEAKLKAAEELAEAIRDKAPVGASLEYRESIEGDLLNSRPHQEQVGIQKSKDPDATGIFAEFIWRFLEFGTAPHNTAKGGGTVLGKATHTAGGGTQHPGTSAQPHIFTTYRAMKPAIKKKIRAAINKGVREAMGKK